MKQAETAATVYRHDIRPTLNDRQRFVREELIAFIASKRYAPTALELLRFASVRNPGRWLDVNSIRPRLNELEALGSIRHGVKRQCDVSGKTVLTWVLSKPEPAVQTGLF